MGCRDEKKPLLRPTVRSKISSFFGWFRRGKKDSINVDNAFAEQKEGKFSANEIRETDDEDAPPYMKGRGTGKLGCVVYVAAIKWGLSGRLQWIMSWKT